MSKEFFIAKMQSAIEACRQTIIARAETSPYKADMLRMAERYQDFTDDNFQYGHMGTAAIDAMGYALLEMPMTDWETFYQGYVEWTKERPKCTSRGQEEENARGAMLMALKDKYEDSQRQKAKAA